jgi:pimeloyl-ACP methyl ester carboxylesterase
MRFAVPLLLVLLAALFLAACVSLRPFSEIRREVPEDRFVRVGDQLVHIERVGQGEPLVLLHGFGASTYAWRKVIPGLAKEFQVIAIDLNGFGYTQRPKDRESYTREGQARLVLGVMDALGIEKAHFMGHSYGGAMTLWVSSRHSERVRSIALVDSAAPTYPEDRRSRFAAVRPLSTLFLRGFGLRPGAIRRALERSVYDDSIVTPELVQAYFDRLRIEGLGDAYYGLTAPSRSRPEIVDLTKIDVPALVVWGAEDELISVDTGRRVSARLPRSTFVVLEKTGHIPMEEKPEELLALLLPFFEGQRG